MSPSLTTHRQRERESFHSSQPSYLASCLVSALLPLNESSDIVKSSWPEKTFVGGRLGWKHYSAATKNSNLAAEPRSCHVRAAAVIWRHARRQSLCADFVGGKMQQHLYTESVSLQDPLTDSDGDDTRPEDGDRQQYMFIWNQTYEASVCVCVCAFGRV